jgi:hypothetical protein
MDKACSTEGEQEVHTKSFLVNLKEKRPFGILRHVYRRIILKWLTEFVKVQTGLDFCFL